MGMEADVARIPVGLETDCRMEKKIVQDCRGNVAVFAATPPSTSFRCEKLATAKQIIAPASFQLEIVVNK